MSKEMNLLLGISYNLSIPLSIILFQLFVVSQYKILVSLLGESLSYDVSYSYVLSLLVAYLSSTCKLVS